MKNKEEKIKNKVDNKINKKSIITKVMAIILLSAMVLASCSTCIYYVVQSL